jgi:hypothetical protein
VMAWPAVVEHHDAGLDLAGLAAGPRRVCRAAGFSLEQIREIQTQEPQSAGAEQMPARERGLEYRRVCVRCVRHGRAGPQTNRRRGRGLAG